MSAAIPVTTAGPGGIPGIITAASSITPVSTPATALKTKIWAVVKPVLLALAILVGTAAVVGLSFGVTLALPLALLLTATVVGAIALGYVLVKGCIIGKNAYVVIQLRQENPKISQTIQDFHLKGFDQKIIHDLVKLHQAKEHLDQLIAGSRNESFREVGNKISSQIATELNLFVQNPSIMTIANYCQNKKAIIEYVSGISNKRDLVKKAIVALTWEKETPARVNDPNFIAVTDFVTKNLQTELDKIDLNMAVPTYCQDASQAIKYVEEIAQKRDLIQCVLHSIKTEKEQPHRKNDPAYMAVADAFIEKYQLQKLLDTMDLNIAVPEAVKPWYLNHTKIKNLIQCIKQELQNKEQSLEDSAIWKAQANHLLQALEAMELDILKGNAITYPDYFKDNQYLLNYYTEIIRKHKLINAKIIEFDKEIQVGHPNPAIVNLAKKIVDHLRQIQVQLNNGKDVDHHGICQFAANRLWIYVEGIHAKKDRIGKAITHIKATAGIPKKVNNYFLNVMTKLERGVDVPLPDFFHGTRRNTLIPIIKSGNIKQFKAQRGTGAFISTNDEGLWPRYGPYTLAIDQSTLEDSEGHVHPPEAACGGSDADTYVSLWACVKMDIPVRDDTIAYLVAPTEAEIPILKELLEKEAPNKLKVDILDRDTSNAIHRVFDSITPARELPSKKWIRNTNWNPTLPMPRNMAHLHLVLAPAS